MDLAKLVNQLPAIKKYWSVTNSSTESTNITQPMVFDGCVEIIICRRGNFAMQFADNILRFPAGMYVAGQITEPMSLRLAENTRLDFIKIERGFANCLTQENIAQLTCQAASLFDLNKTAFMLLLPLFENPEHCYALTKLNTYMMSQQDDYSQFTVYATRSLAQLMPYVEVKQKLIDECQLSTRSFEMRFKRSVGINPKKYAALLKLRLATETIRDNVQFGSLTDLALDMGYYDQAHFCRSLNQFLGSSARKVNFSKWFVPDSRDTVRFYTI